MEFVGYIDALASAGMLIARSSKAQRAVEQSYAENWSWVKFDPVMG